VNTPQAEAVLEAIRSRRSVRRFAPDPVGDDVLRQLVTLAAWAPTASNRQDWFFTVVTSAEVRRRMAEAVRRRWDAIVAAHPDIGGIDEIGRYAARFAEFAEAPAVVAVSSRAPGGIQVALLGEDAEAVSGGVASAAMAAQTLMLAAHALGLGSCCMTGALAAHRELAPLLGLSRRDGLVCLVAVGRPAEVPPAPERKPVGEISRILS
jgi:nitroreductase